MKRTLAYSLFLALAVSAVAQTPTVTEQPATKPASTTTKPAVSVKTANIKPSPVTAKTGSAPQKTASAKPAVVAVKPVTAKPVAVSTAKTNTTAAPKPVPATAATKTVAVPGSKTTSAAAVKPVAVPVVKPVANMARPVAGAKPAPAAAHPVAVPVAVAAGQPKGALVAVKAPAKAEPKGKNPFSKKEAPGAGVKSVATTAVAVQDSKSVSVKKPEPRKINAAGRRDPFISPVVSMGAVGSGCSSGKRCLAIDQIALKGVVKSDNGMIAVVVNAMDKAYFLRENDPVFNGYVVKITGDSIVFKETFHDKLGKPLTRDVTKTISRPVA